MGIFLEKAIFSHCFTVNARHCVKIDKILYVGTLQHLNTRLKSICADFALICKFKSPLYSPTGCVHNNLEYKPKEGHSQRKSPSLDCGHCLTLMGSTKR